MADHATLFAVSLDVGSRENLVRARQIYGEAPENPDSEIPFLGGFQLDVEGAAHNTALRISATQFGDTGAVIRFVRRCAEEFSLVGSWGFEWAHTSSSPILHSFGGGALVLDLATGETLAWIDTHGWLVRHLAQSERKS